MVPSVRISFSNIEHLPGETWFNFRNNKQPLAIKINPDIIAPNETLCQMFKEQLTIKWLPMECTKRVSPKIGICVKGSSSVDKFHKYLYCSKWYKISFNVYYISEDISLEEREYIEEEMREWMCPHRISLTVIDEKNVMNRYHTRNVNKQQSENLFPNYLCSPFRCV